MQIAEDSDLFLAVQGSVFPNFKKDITSKISFTTWAGHNCVKHTVKEIQMFAEVYQLFEGGIAVAHFIY